MGAEGISFVVKQTFLRICGKEKQNKHNGYLAYEEQFMTFGDIWKQSWTISR